MAKRSQNELIWNDDLISILEKELGKISPKVNVTHGKVLKDIFLAKSSKKGNYLQLGFVDQDVIISNEILDISDLNGIDSIQIHNFPKEKRFEGLVIPKLIVELKYNGITSHGLKLYSEYAREIKSIFPGCKYYLAAFYNKTSTENKLHRHGQFFDKIFYFKYGVMSKGEKYQNGDFQKLIENNKEANSRFRLLIDSIKKDLNTDQGRLQGFW